MRFTDTDSRFACYNMPTGSGKSLIPYMVGELMGVRTLVLTSTKALQRQISRDSLADEEIKGQENYECLAVRPFGPLREYASRDLQRINVDRGPCHVGVPCWMKFNGCTYFDQVRAARNCQGTVSTNYAYWMSLGKAIRAGRGEEQLGKFGLLVLDEAHAAVNNACDALRIDLPVGELGGLLGIRPLTVNASLDQWRNWGNISLMRWADEMDRMTAALKHEYIDGQLIDDYKTMQEIGTALEQISMLSGEWVVGESWKSVNITFDPVWPTDYAEDILFRGIPKVMLLSATVTPKTMDILGIKEVERDYVEYPSTFPLELRPVYIMVGLPRVDAKMSAADEEEWIWYIDECLGPRIEAGRNGIIHCVSYARMERIKMMSKYRRHFITNSDSTQTQEAIERFRRNGGILLSPSVTTGEDFPDDQCRFIIVAKLPFGDPRNPIAMRRSEDDPDYGGWEMMTTFAQSCGRGNRNKGDWSESIVLDGNAEWALPKYKNHAPEYFRDAWIWRSTMPGILEV